MKTVQFTKEKNGAEYTLENVPDDAIITIEKNNTERDLVIKSADGKLTYGVVRGVASVLDNSLTITKKAKKDWVDGA